MAAPFDWGKIEWRKLLTGMAMAGFGALVPVFLQWVSSTDWGPYMAPLMGAVAATAVNALRLWIKNLTGIDPEPPPNDPITGQPAARCNCCGRPFQ